MATEDKTQTAVATTAAAGSVPAHLQARAKEIAGLGNSTASTDNSLPFLAIIQKGSPQVNKQKPEFIKGAEVGDLLNTATGRIFKADADNGLVVIPFAFQKNYVEWVPRDSGGGYVATHEFSKAVYTRLGAIEQKKGPPVLPNGNQLVETAYTFVLIEDSPMPLVIGATSTALGAMRNWMSMRNEFLIDGQPAPAFSRRYLFNTVYKENDQGDWYQPKMSDLGWLEDEALFNRALGFAEQAAAGDITVGRPTDPDAAAAPGSDTDDGIPV